MGRTSAETHPVERFAGLSPSTRVALPRGLHVLERAPAGGWDGAGVHVVVPVHGSLDRAASFSRTVRRLPELGVVVYDRRGYQGSRAAGTAPSLGAHVEDLVAIARAYDAPRGVVGSVDRVARQVSAVGHSVGGTIVLGAAIADPTAFASVGAYEPSMPWLGFHRSSSGDRRRREPLDPGAEAEAFFRRMAGHAAWERLSERQRDERRADGAALLADLRAIGGPAPFDAKELEVPAIVAAGGSRSFPHHRDTVGWLAEHVTSVERAGIADAGHGAHLSHPDAFAEFVCDVVARSSRADPRRR